MRKRLLIVDDNDDFRAMLKEYLNLHKLDLDIYESSSGEMGLTKASCIKPDIVIMDISLPQTNGLVIARNIKEDRPSCHVIFLTALDLELFKKAAEEIKARAFIAKKEVFEQVVPAIKKCLEV